MADRHQKIMIDRQQRSISTRCSSSVEADHELSIASALTPEQRGDVIGFPIASLLFDQQIETMLSWAKKRLSRIVFVANVHMLVEGSKDIAFSRMLRSADLVTPDGMPLVWMLRWLTGEATERVAGMDILLALCERAAIEQVSVYFFGAEQTTLDLMHAKLQVQFPELCIAGMRTLPFCDEFTPAQDRESVQLINESGAGLVFVALGCPKQEKWMYKNRDRVNAVMVGIGGAFSVYAGLQKWAPLWVRTLGLEWCYRLYQEPRRLWKRYLVTNSHFIWLVITQMRAQVRARSQKQQDKARLD